VILKVAKTTALTGASALYLLIGLGLLIGKIFLMYWVSDLFYSWGLWPIGVLVRLVALLEIVAAALVAIFIVISLISGSIGLVASWMRRKTA
jgi:hypothetical protein